MKRSALGLGVVALFGLSGLAAQTAPDEYTQWEKEIARSFIDLDTDGDRALNPEEAAERPPLGSHFSMADIDGNGQLSVEEFAAFEILQDSIEIRSEPSI